MSTVASIYRIHVKPDIGPGTRGWMCTVCERDLDKEETLGHYRHANHPDEVGADPTGDHQHLVCNDCLASGAAVIARRLADRGAKRRSEAERARRRAAALRTDPTLAEDVDAEERRADRLDSEAELLDRDAAAEWHLPTVADLRALEREIPF